jgi:hypothetical protein
MAAGEREVAGYSTCETLGVQACATKTLMATCSAESRRRPMAAGKIREIAEVTPMVATAMLMASLVGERKGGVGGGG